MHTNRHKRSKPRHPRRKGRPTRPFPRAENRSISRSSPLVSPDEMDVRLRFRKTAALTGTAGGGYVKLQPNAAYDVDPSLGSTETYGFDEYAALYTYYRVISYSYHIQVSNASTTTPVNIYVMNTNTDPTLAGTNFSLYSTNPYSQTRQLAKSPASSSSTQFRGHHQVAKILGSGVVETDDNFRSLTTGIPSDLTWLTMAVENVAVTGGDANVNLSYIIDVTMNVRFYGREVDLTLAGLQKRLNLIANSRRETQLKKRISSNDLPRFTHQ